MTSIEQKPMLGAKGGRDFKVCQRELKTRTKVLKEDWNVRRYVPLV